MLTARRYWPFRLHDFSGGVNFRDAATELASNDLSTAYNITLDERGGANSRLGFSKYNSSPYGGGTVSAIFYWQTGGNVITQAGASLYKDTSTVLIKTFSTSARCAMADFAGKLCIVHPVDGMFTYDGATFTAIATGPKADTIAVWQNKLWTNDKSGTHPARINFCAAGDPTTWNAADTNDLRDVDDAQVVCVGVAGGSDIIDRAGLHVFKQRSSYWVYDSATGAYQTVDPTVGAASALCSVYVGGRTLVLSERGIYATEGNGGFTKVSGKLDPLFNVGVLAWASLSSFCAGRTQDRAFFTIRTNSSALSIEYHPLEGWFTTGSNAATCYSWGYPSGLVGAQLLTGAVAVSGQVYVQLSGGLDDATSIFAQLQTRFVELNGGMRTRLNLGRVNGRGAFTLFPLFDYDWTQSTTRAISVPTGSNSIHGGYQDVFNLGKGKSFGFNASATTNSIGGVPLAYDTSATTRPVGAWGFYGIDLTAVVLGRT